MSFFIVGVKLVKYVSGGGSIPIFKKLKKLRGAIPQCKNVVK